MGKILLFSFYLGFFQVTHKDMISFYKDVGVVFFFFKNVLLKSLALSNTVMFRIMFQSTMSHIKMVIAKDYKGAKNSCLLVTP